MPKVILSKNAAKELSRLPQKDQKKIIKKLKALKNDPLLGKKLTGKLKGLWSCRAWPYRIVYQARSKKKSVSILQISHRQSVYK